MSVYYRVIKSYRGQQAVFTPKQSYEQVEVENGGFRLIERQGKVNEVCFAKTIEGCLFAINMYLEEGDYHIYQTSEVPCVDLSSANLIDFAAIEEVRYRKDVSARYYGKIEVTSFMIYALREAYKECNYGKTFNNEHGKTVLQSFLGLKKQVVPA